MNISGINHINIVTTASQLPEVVSFYERILGLKQGLRAPSKRGGAWLYNGETAIVHVSVVEQPPYAGKDTLINHVALACSNVAAFLAVLNDNHIPYTVDYRTPPEMSQIFFYDPIGVKIELNFPGEKLPVNPEQIHGT